MPQNYVQIWTFFALFLMILTTFKGFFSGVLEGNSCFISFLMIKWLQQSLSPVWTNMEFRPHHPFTHEQATPSGDFLEKNHKNLSYYINFETNIHLDMKIFFSSSS